MMDIDVVIKKSSTSSGGRCQLCNKHEGAIYFYIVENSNPVMWWCAVCDKCEKLPDFQDRIKIRLVTDLL